MKKITQLSKESQATSSCNYTAKQLSAELFDYLSKYKFYNPLTKRNRVIAWLIVASNHNKKVTRFDASFIGDTCFNTTVSEITLTDDIIVNRRETKRPVQYGKPTDCKEYWIEGLALEKAKRLIYSLGRRV